MEENENKQTNDLRQDAVNTFNQTKEEIKNMDIKEEVQKGKGLIAKLFFDPIGTIKEIVDDDKNHYFKTAIFVIGVWLVAIALKLFLNHIVHKYNYTFIAIVRNIVNPLLRILVFAVILHVFNKNSTKALPKTITAVSIAYIPTIISAVLGFLTFISSKVTYVTNPIGSLLAVIATVLRFFVTKEVLRKEDNKEALKSFIKVEAVYYVIAFALSFLELSL